MTLLAVALGIVKIIIAFSILVLIHELGHFIVAKKSGVWVEEFGLGLPPRIFGKKIGETLYSINWLPIGGFVRLHGETSSDEVTDPKRAFTRKSKPKRIVITLAGIVMNMILGVVCFSALFWAFGVPATGKFDLVITDTVKDTPAYTAGVKAGDIVKKVDGVDVSGDENLFKSEVDKNKGKEIVFEVKRGNNLVDLKLTPRANPPAGQGSLGVEFESDQAVYYPPLWQRPFVVAWYGIKQTFTLSKAIIFGLGQAAQSVSHGQAPKGLAGPVGIVALFWDFAQLGFLPLVNLVGVISVNLAIINLIPFPPLDGSRIALVIAEWITKKKLTAKMEERVYLVGFIILIGIMVLVTSREIPALIKSGSLTKYANTLLNQH